MTSKKNTKEKIFNVSLDLFSQKGYDAVSIREIAREVGIRESSIYNHYPSKKSILIAIFDFFKNHLSINDMDNKKLMELLDEDPVLFYHNGAQLFKEQVQNEKIVKIMKILFIQMYQDKTIKDFFIKEMIEGPINFWTLVFSILIKNGVIKKLDPKSLAKEYYGYAMFLLLEISLKYDSFPEEALNELFDKVEKHASFLFDIIKVDDDE